MAEESSDKSVVAQLSFELGIDTDSLYKELKQFVNKTDRQLTTSFTNTGKSMGKKLLAGLGFGAAINKLKDFVNSSIELGSNLTEVQNVVDTSFKTMSSAVNAFAKDAMYNFGLSETVAKKYMGTIGAMNNAFGFTEKASYDMAEAVTGLVGDVASFYNLESDEAFTKLKSIWTGETETLKDLGVVMTQTALDQYALNNGFGKTTAKMTEQEKVMLRYQYVTNALSDATGDFVKTQDTWANQTRVLSLRIESLKATMGQGFINLFTPILRGLNSMLEKLSAVAEGFKLFTETITGTTSVTQGFENVATGAANAAGSVDNITTSLQEAKRELAGFDKISKLGDENSNTSSGGSTSTDTNMGNVGDAAGEVNTMASSIAEGLEPLRKLIEDWKIGDFFSVGGDVSDLVIQINDFIAEAISSADWDGLGANVGAFLKGIKWLDIFKSLWGVLHSAIDGAVDFYFGMFEEAPFETAFITAIGLWKLTGISNAIVGKINDKLGTALSAEKFSFSSVLNMAFKVVIAYEIGGTIGYKLGSMLMEAINPELEAFYDEFDGLDKIGDYIFGDGILDGLKDLAFNLGPAIDEVVGQLMGFKPVEAITTFFGDIWDGISDGIDWLFGKTEEKPLEITISADVQNFSRKINEAVSLLEDFKTSSKETLKNVDAEYENAFVTAQKYFELSQKDPSLFTEADLANLKSYRDTLESYGIDMKSSVDSVTNAWKGTNEELLKLIENQRNASKLQAYSDIIQEAQKQDITLRRDLQEAFDQFEDKDLLANLWSRYNLGETEYDDKLIKRLAKQYGKTTDEVGSAIKAFNSLNKIYFAVSENQEYMNDLSEEYIQVQKNMGYISEDVSNDMLKDTRNVLDGITTGIHASEGGIYVFADKVEESVEDVTTKVEEFGERTGQVSEKVAGMDFSIDVNTDEGKVKVAELETIFDEAEKKRTTDITADTTQAIDNVRIGVSAMNIGLGLIKTPSIKVKTSEATKGVNMAVNTMNATFSALKTQSISLDTSNAKQQAETLKTTIESKLKGINIGLQVKVQAKIKDAMAAAINIGKEAKQGIGTITAFAKGGFPEDGLFFANHNELVGKFSNGNTAVANNEQILTGIEKATASGILGGLAAVNLRSSMASPPPLAMTGKYSANENEIKQMVQEVVAQNNAGSGYTKEMLIVLKELLQLVKELDLDIVIDGKKLKDIIVDQINRHTQQTGVCEIQI